MLKRLKGQTKMLYLCISVSVNNHIITISGTKKLLSTMHKYFTKNPFVPHWVLIFFHNFFKCIHSFWLPYPPEATFYQETKWGRGQKIISQQNICRSFIVNSCYMITDHARNNSQFFSLFWGKEPFMISISHLLKVCEINWIRKTKTHKTKLHW